MRFQSAPQDVQDSLDVAPDSSDVIGELGREVGETGRLLVSGDLQGVVDRILAGAQSMLEAFLPATISAVFVFLVFYLGYRAIAGVLDASLRRSNRVDEGLRHLLVRSFRIAAWAMIFVMVLSQFGIDVTALLAGLSIVGIAVGFAAKDTLENFISGIAIMLDRPFHVGDYLNVDGTYGQVQQITLRSTRLRTVNDEIMVMPNIAMINQKLVNHSLMQSLRVVVPFGIAYKEYPAEAREVVLGLFEGDTRLDPERPPRVVVTEMADSAVNLEARFFILNPGLEVPMRLEYTEKIREALREANIEIPFPHLQMFIDGADGLRDVQSSPTVDPGTGSKPDNASS
ncbi:MAG: mechanosensitive ion channel family protein [Rhodothermales bacterium]|nr:mechanosensitive ion channel family protein [Rhodothermales bacterium]